MSKELEISEIGVQDSEHQDPVSHCDLPPLDDRSGFQDFIRLFVELVPCLAPRQVF